MKPYKGKIIAHLIAFFILLSHSCAFAFQCPTMSQIRATRFDQPVKKGDGYFVVGKVLTDFIIYPGIVKIHNEDNPDSALQIAQEIITNSHLHEPVTETISGNREACVYYGNIRNKTNPSVFVVDWDN